MSNFLSSFFKRDQPEVKGLTISHQGVWDGFTPLGAVHGHSSDTAALQATMQTSELVYACLTVKATAASDPRLIVQALKSKRDGSGGRDYVEVLDHPLRRLIARPNAMMSESDLMRAAIVSWDTTNPRKFYVEKEYKRGLLIGLWPLNPACMAPRYRQDGSGQTLIGYTWANGGRTVNYTLDDLIIRSGPAWFSPSPSVAGAGSVRSDQAQTDYIGSFFENGGMPSVYMKDSSRAISNEQREEVRRRWQATYGNRSSGQHGIGVLDMHQEIQKLGSDLKDLDSETLRMVAESRICMVYGVPPLIVYAYVGLMRATYSNLKEAWASFWDYTLSPALKEWREFWTRTLLAEFEDRADIDSGRIRLAYDMSTVAAMADDVEQMEARATNSYTKGVRQLNEARAILGLPPVADGDVFYRAPTQTPGGMSDDNEKQP